MDCRRGNDGLSSNARDDIGVSPVTETQRLGNYSTFASKNQQTGQIRQFRVVGFTLPVQELAHSLQSK